MSYDKAYNEWDAMTAQERISWCERKGTQTIFVDFEF